MFGYGQPGDIPVCGDWDGNGTDTPGIVRNGTWYLSQQPGQPVRRRDASRFGDAAGDIPVVGDWNGDGIDTPGVVRNGTWYLSNTAWARPRADLVFGYGNPTGDIAGRRATGTATATTRPAWCATASGTWSTPWPIPLADVSFAYGDPGDTPLAGRWARRAPTIGIAR